MLRCIGHWFLARTMVNYSCRHAHTLTPTNRTTLVSVRMMSERDTKREKGRMRKKKRTPLLRSKIRNTSRLRMRLTDPAINRGSLTEGYIPQCLQKEDLLKTLI
jgi:hypothetical protein